MVMVVIVKMMLVGMILMVTMVEVMTESTVNDVDVDGDHGSDNCVLVILGIGGLS